MVAFAAVHRHVVRHKGPAALRLHATKGRPLIFWGLRSVRRFRPCVRGRQIEPESRRDSDPIRKPYLWRDSDFPVSAWLDAHSHGLVRLSTYEGALDTNGGRV